MRGSLISPPGKSMIVARGWNTLYKSTSSDPMAQSTAVPHLGSGLTGPHRVRLFLTNRLLIKDATNKYGNDRYSGKNGQGFLFHYRGCFHYSGRLL